MIRVVLADDHSVLRAGLRALLEGETDMEVVGEAGDGTTCVDITLQTTPDVVVLDINMPVCGGLEALPALLDASPASKVLVLTMHDDPGYLRQVLMSGGSGFVLKQSAADELLAAIRTVAAGRLYVSPEHAKAFLDGATAAHDQVSAQSGQESRYDLLSDREAEIFELSARGLTNAEMSRRLHLSVKTVETYKARMMKKLAVDNRAAIVRLALELDILK